MTNKELETSKIYMWVSALFLLNAAEFNPAKRLAKEGEKEGKNRDLCPRTVKKRCAFNNLGLYFL